MRTIYWKIFSCWSCQQEVDAKRFQIDMETRLNRFGLALSPEKTHRIECGTFAIKRAKARGEKAATFDFPGFTHDCSRTRDGKRFRIKTPDGPS
ncbi:MAG: hypothetical protein CVV13_11970 [Gammaproteobacteria bacterium HGW-Gammaproteobacteria-3]|nr:MAG: hypothetical protein CVV13_11970 [Gammaproteobacteria bacterium HGW-Gammaproteobacteria-3]